MRKIVIAMSLVAMSLVAMSLVAADYSQMTTDELSALRGTVAVEDREVFRAEMQSRMQAMTPEERREYRVDRGFTKGQGLKDGSGKGKKNQGANKGQGNGKRIQQRLRDGSGAGSMNQNIDRVKKQQDQGTRQKLKDGSVDTPHR